MRERACSFELAGVTPPAGAAGSGPGSRSGLTRRPPDRRGGETARRAERERSSRPSAVFLFAGVGARSRERRVRPTASPGGGRRGRERAGAGVVRLRSGSPPWRCVGGGGGERRRGKSGRRRRGPARRPPRPCSEVIPASVPLRRGGVQGASFSLAPETLASVHWGGSFQVYPFKFTRMLPYRL